MSFRYQLSRWSLASDIRLPELSGFELPDDAVANTHTDIEIRMASVPAALTKSVLNRPAVQADKDDFLLRIVGLVRIRVRSGRLIEIDPDAGGDERDFRCFLFGPVMAALLQQRGMLVMHASAVRVGDSACLLAGDSTIGKSSLAARLDQRGYPALSDELSIIDISVSPPVLLPYLPRLLLWKDAMQAFGYEPQESRRQRANIELYSVAIDGFKEELPVGAVFILADERLKPVPWLESMTAIDAVVAARSASYQARGVEDMGRRKQLFAQLNALVKAVPVQRLWLRRRWNFVNETVDLLREHWAKASDDARQEPR